MWRELAITHSTESWCPQRAPLLGPLAQADAHMPNGGDVRGHDSAVQCAHATVSVPRVSQHLCSQGK